MTLKKAKAAAPEPTPSSLLERKTLIEKVLPALSGALAFAAIRTAYFQYYGSFGLTPEAAGISVSRVLSDLLIGPLLLGTAFGLICFSIYGCQVWLREKRIMTWSAREDAQLRIAAAALSLGMLASAASVTVLAGSAAARVHKDCKPFSSIGFYLWIVRLPLLQISARRIKDFSLNGTVSKPIDLSPRDCLLVVAEGDGRTYIYNTATNSLQSVSTNVINYTTISCRKPWETCDSP